MARVLFIQTEWFEQLGVLSLAGFVRAHGHEPSIIVSRKPERAVPEVIGRNPDVVALSATTGAHRAALAMARALRPRFPGLIIMGGPHPTFFPEVIEDPSLDAVCRGEGETPLTELLDRLDRGEDLGGAPGFWIRQNGGIKKNPPAELIRDLDSLPPMARDLYDRADNWYKRTTMRRVLAGRGCPYRCSYCFNESLREMVKGKGPYVRLRGVDNLIAECKHIAASGAGTINFTDDTFGLRRDWALEFLGRYRAEVGTAFIVNLRPEQVDAQLASALSEAGCYCAQIGVESASPERRREILNRETTAEQLEQAARLIKENRIKLLTYNMVGLPGETLDEAAQTIAWNADMRVDFPRISIFQPYPRTVIGDRALGGAGCSPEDADKIGESYFRCSPLAGPEARAIENLHKLFYLYLKFPALRGAVKAVSRLPANPLFDAAFLAAMAVQYRAATNRTVPETLLLGLRNLGAYFA